MEIKKITDYTSEELASMFSEEFKKYADATKFNMSTVNEPCEIYLPFDYNTNKLIYEEAKKNYSYTNIRYRFLVRPIYPELYEYIKKDIEDNNLKHEVVLLPYLTSYNLKEVTKKKDINVYGSPIDTIQFLKTRENLGSAFWLRLDYVEKHILELEEANKFKHSKDQVVKLYCDDGEGELQIVRSEDDDIHFHIMGYERGRTSVRFRQSGSSLKGDKHYEINRTLNLLMSQLEDAYPDKNKYEGE